MKSCPEQLSRSGREKGSFTQVESPRMKAEERIPRRQQILQMQMMSNREQV